MDFKEISNDANNFELKEINKRAEMLIGQSKYESAKEVLDKALGMDENFIDTYVNLGNLYANLEDYKNAQKSFKKAIVLDKKNPIHYFSLGNVKFIQGDIEAGVENYNKAILNGYDDAKIYLNLGIIYEEINKFEMAIRNYAKAIRKDKLNPEYRIKLAQAYIKNSKFDEALKVLEELNSYCSDIFEGYHYRFQIYCFRKEYEKARLVIDSAIEKFPNDISLFYDKVKLLNLEEKFDEALILLNKAKTMDDYELEERNFEFENAKIHAQKEDVENTVKCLNKCISLEKDKVDAEARYLLMNLYLTTDKQKELLEQSQALLKYDYIEKEYKMSALYYEAYSLNKLGMDEAKSKYEEAIKIFRGIAISEPNNLDAYMFRVMCHKDIKEYDKALELVDYILLLKDDVFEFYSIKSGILAEKGDEEAAKAVLANASKYESVFSR